MNAQSLRFALATPSYRGDLARCELLCASVDRFVGGLSMHYLLIEDNDVGLFRHLEGRQRRIIPESTMLPAWLASIRDPAAADRRLWTSFGALARGVPPLRGWHMQQLRKLAIARYIDEDVIQFADSDAVLLRPYDLTAQVVGGRTRLYARASAITADMQDQVRWLRRAERLLGLDPTPLPATDYIGHLATWRSDTARALLAHIEQRNGCDWITAVARSRSISEYLLYGNWATRLDPRRGELLPTPLAPIRTYWNRELVSGREQDGTAPELEPHEIGVGFQSFIGFPLERQWDMFRAAAG